MQRKCVFLDRDGVLNRERGDYTYTLEDFEVLPGVPEALALLKQNGYLLIVVTNQGGIAKGLYTKADVMACHQKLQDGCSQLIDAIYYAPSHPNHSESLSRKPNSLMLERAMARYSIDPTQSWMIGDSHRDLEAAQKVGIRSIIVGDKYAPDSYTWQVNDLWEAAQLILREEGK
ncbi:HAD family hydrolase [Pontibacter sp. HSC-14F20]|uniref:D-glycero-alpha-D-manno-heptose-1,7-bisphosphate 7-phosphatase n=1 Tax=Pontibacter sp. HSC-14F20 TaxID=2864136 RepID=UPI001C730678|nr:HAD family hydrolase [Pontibacter sp. HSC-14F20]MBX0334454.1 HAD family hydrolase [Pontibacter sp. HSC-14F20]